MMIISSERLFSCYWPECSTLPTLLRLPKDKRLQRGRRRLWLSLVLTPSKVWLVFMSMPHEQGVHSWGQGFSSHPDQSLVILAAQLNLFLKSLSVYFVLGTAAYFSFVMTTFVLFWWCRLNFNLQQSNLGRCSNAYPDSTLRASDSADLGWA